MPWGFHVLDSSHEVGDVEHSIAIWKTCHKIRMSGSPKSGCYTFVLRPALTYSQCNPFYSIEERMVSQHCRWSRRCCSFVMVGYGHLSWTRSRRSVEAHKNFPKSTALLQRRQGAERWGQTASTPVSKVRASEYYWSGGHAGRHVNVTSYNNVK